MLHLYGEREDVHVLYSLWLHPPRSRDSRACWKRSGQRVNSRRSSVRVTMGSLPPTSLLERSSTSLSWNRVLSQGSGSWIEALIPSYRFDTRAVAHNMLNMTTIGEEEVLRNCDERGSWKQNMDWKGKCQICQSTLQYTRRYWYGRLSIVAADTPQSRHQQELVLL